MIWTVLALMTLGAASDPRIEIVDAQLKGDARQALALVENALRSEPETSRGLGFDYLRGDLLEDLDRHRDADRAFAEAMSGNRQLSDYSRYRLAVNQSRRGHPEVAAGLLATLLARTPPPYLVEPAARLLTEALANGGDCRLLRELANWPLSGEPRRLLEVAAVDCAAAITPPTESRNRLLRLLEETIVDEPARLAAERLHRRFASALEDREELLLVGRTFHHQRRFDLAETYLSRGIAASPPTQQSSTDEAEARYALARSLFWQEKYERAVQEFGQIALDERSAEDRARALYQQARSYELDRSLAAAANSFRQAYLEDTEGRWAAAALLSTLRLEWLRGREDEALALFEVLGSRRSWSEMHGRAALFIASSDLVQGRADRAAQWLSAARLASRKLRPLTDYWSGRLHELSGEAERAVSAYVDVIAHAPFEPLAQFAYQRLAHEDLQAVALARGEELARNADIKSLSRAQLLLGDRATGTEALDKARERLALSRTAEPFLRLAFVQPGDWPLWEARLAQPEDMLLALGIWNEGEPAARRHFPLSEISLAYTASRLLARDGVHRPALRISEVLYRGALSRMPENLIPVPLRRAAFPLPYGTLIADAAAQHQIDPYVLTALIREESRFDRRAVSAASARGLTQFVLSTARRLAPRAGLEQITAEDLHRPEISIALGAAYLAELLEDFDGRVVQAVAAYNAGERQAELWQSYCFSNEPEEFLTKVGFPETRGYLTKVLESRAQYAALYPPGTFATQ